MRKRKSCTELELRRRPSSLDTQSLTLRRLAKDAHSRTLAAYVVACLQGILIAGADEDTTFKVQITLGLGNRRQSAQ